jgi:CheY-like chemotaxis protein
MTAETRPARILHVEDEPLNRSLFRAVIERANDPRIRSAVVEEAADLGQARAYLGDNDVDIVLLDVRLPDGNGLDLVREIKAREPGLTVVVMSASVLPDEREQATRAGCDAFISKPYSPRDLLDTMIRLLPPA